VADPMGDISKLRDAFVLEFGTEQLLADFDRALSQEECRYGEAASAFRYNLTSVLAVVSLPNDFACSSALRVRSQMLFSAERIRLSPLVVPEGEEPPPAPSQAEIDGEAAAAALAMLKDETSTADGRASLRRAANRVLLESLSEERVVAATRELHRQGLVLAWGALEGLAKDVFVAHLNMNPSSVNCLSEHPQLRKRFGLKALDLAVLEEHGFDVSGSLGDILIGNYDLSDIVGIRAVFSALFPNDQSLRAGLGTRELWVLSQKRHLLVHRRGIVDVQYIEKTGDSLKPGDSLPVTPHDVKEALSLVRDAGMQIILAPHRAPA
jgi:hypothetical protein